MFILKPKLLNFFLTILKEKLIEIKILKKKKKK